MSETAGALAGIRVLDFSRVLAGPYATMTMGDLGADVIKVEGPAGDDTRRWTPPTTEDGTSTYYLAVNRNKRSVVLDLTTTADRDRALELARAADVVVENFRPGTMARFGLAHETLSAQNPGLISVSISGFGDGPGAEFAGYDLLVQAVGGLMSITGEAGGAPTKVGVAIVDVLTGMNAVIATLAALRAREIDGLGQHVKVNLLSSALSALVNQASSVLLGGTDPFRMGNDHPSIAPYAVYATASGDLVLTVGNDRQFAALARLVGRDDWTSDHRFGTNEDRVMHREDLRRELESELATAPAHTWQERLTAAGVPAGAVNSVSAAIELAAELELDPVVAPAGGSGPVTVRSPLFLSRHSPAYRTAPPAFDSEARSTDWLPRPTSSLVRTDKET